jgi:preprotein translocase SecE subunit
MATPKKSKKDTADQQKNRSDRPTPIKAEVVVDSSNTATANTLDSSDKTDGSSRRKRQLKPAPTTVRQQSEEALTKSGQPSKRQKVGRAASKPFRFLAILGRPFRWLGKFRLFRWIGYIFAPPYLRNSLKELRLVTWPTRKQSRQLTFAVIVFSLIFGLLAAITDYGLDKLFRGVILKH